MKNFKDFKEDVAMSATGVSGGGPLAGAPPDFPPVPAGVTTLKRRRSPIVTDLLRRKKPVSLVKKIIGSASRY